MALPEKALTIHAARWTAETEHLIAKALTDATVEDIKRQTESGNAKLFSVCDEDAEIVAAFVLRVDAQVNKNVGVVVAAGSEEKDLDMTAAMMPYIETMFTGCQSLRVHTARPGLVKKLCRLNWKVAGIELTKELNHG